MTKESPPLHIVNVNALVIKGDKFLAGLRSKDEIAYPGVWSIPGGKVEIGKTIEETVVEEVREETGIEVKNIFYIANSEFTRPDGYHVVSLTFACEYANGEAQALDDTDEVRWLTLDEADGLDFFPGAMELVRLGFREFQKRKA